MFASRMLRMAVTKTSTGLVGLKVNPNARQDLIKIYRRTLEEVKILPPEAKNYRNAVEQITKFRLNVVETNEDEDVIERKINCGQLEELIEQAEDELSVIPVYIGALGAQAVGEPCRSHEVIVEKTDVSIVGEQAVADDPIGKGVPITLKYLVHSYQSLQHKQPESE